MRTSFDYSADMTLDVTQSDGVAVLALRHPPVNALGLELRRALVEALERIDADASISAVVLHGAGKGFCAGGDRSEFGTPAATTRPTLSRDVLSRIEACRKPVLAAIHGFAMGGGLELALACHARIATATARVGLPEVGIGRFPLSGSQRLPRLLGIERAAGWMLRAETMAASHPDARPLFDHVVEHDDDLLPAALARARESVQAPPRLLRHRPIPDADPRSALQAVEARLATRELGPAHLALLAALHAAVESTDFQAGLDRAQVLFDELVG